MSYSAPVCSLTSSSKSTKQAQQILESISSVLFLCLLGVHVRCIDAVFFVPFQSLSFSFCIFSIFFSFYQQQFWIFLQLSSLSLQLFFFCYGIFLFIFLFTLLLASFLLLTLYPFLIFLIFQMFQ